MLKFGITDVTPAYMAVRFLNKTSEKVCAKTMLLWEYRIAGEVSTDETPRWLVSFGISYRQRPVSLIFVELDASGTKVCPTQPMLNGRVSKWRLW